MNGSILGLATEVPTYTISQSQAFEKMAELFPHDEEKLRKLYQNSAITKRHVVTNDFISSSHERSFLGSDYPRTIPGMTCRNDIYKKESLLLAHAAAKKALADWGGDPASITHVISVSCTGVVIPGVDFQLIMSLNLKRSVYRLGINFMGCFGAFKGLEVAGAFAKENPNNRILLVCTELCSLHIQADGSSDSLVANSIFADGSAAVVIGSAPHGLERAHFEMVKHKSFALDGSAEQMSWEASDNGFVMKLSSYVPVSIARNIGSFASSLIDPYVAAESCSWAIHPGGKAIIQTIEKKLDLKEWQTKSSWKTLAQFGNMSSATFLFVLKDLIDKKDKPEWTAGLGFGPGLSIEGILLRC
jgi:predicted naringenin-chalcone synthase